MQPLDYINELPIVSTHEHHIAFANAARINSLEAALAEGYVRHCGEIPAEPGQRGRFL